jgi:membrane fusion protein, multidrug efflux system
MTSRLVLTTVLVLLGAQGCGKPKAQGEAQGAINTPPRETRVRVEVAKVAPSSAELEFTFPGEVKGARDALLASALGGFVESVSAKNGDAVKRGEVLARIDTSIHVARRDQARAEHEQAKSDRTRVQAMGEAASRAQREASQTRLLIAEAGLKLAEAQVARSLIVAPFDGVIGQMELDVGEVTPPGAPVARLVQLQPVLVTVSVADRDVAALRPGMPAKVSIDARPEVYPGTVARVSPVGNLRTRAFEAEIEVPTAQGQLLPGMIARVKVAATAAEQSIVLPQDAVVTRTNEVGVYLDEGGVARWRPLRLGKVVGNQVVVAEGLLGGERLVVTGHRELADGDRLDVSREGVCCRRGRVLFAGGEAVR